MHGPIWAKKYTEKIATQTPEDLKSSVPSYGSVTSIEATILGCIGNAVLPGPFVTNGVLQTVGACGTDKPVANNARIYLCKRTSALLEAQYNICTAACAQKTIFPVLCRVSAVYSFLRLFRGFLHFSLF